MSEARERGVSVVEIPVLESEAPEELMFHDQEFDDLDTHVQSKLDRFHVITLLGVGAYGRVFLVRDLQKDALLAMKVIHKDQVLKGNLVRHAHSERDVLIGINHPFVVNLRYAFQTPKSLYLLMDFVPGGELFSRLNTETFLLESHAMFYTAEIILALEAMHENGIIYRDLKPENILIHRDGHVCLTDFGLAKYSDDEPVDEKASHTFCGTLEYMAPEVIDRGQKYTKMVDWWSVGVLLFEMLTGDSPFQASNPATVQRKILACKFNMPSRLSNDAKSLVKALLTKNALKRLGSKNGASDLKRHRFFRPIKWDLLELKQMSPPYVPDLAHPEDVHHFDGNRTTSTSSQHQIPNTVGQQHFHGFSYTHSHEDANPLKRLPEMRFHNDER